MSSQDVCPKWWQLYLTFPLLVGLFAVDSRLKIAVRGHQMVQIGIILLVYGLMRLWLKSNSKALSEMDQKYHSGGFTVIRIPPSQLSETGGHPMPQLPDSEIYGVLDGTFEMDYIDAESYPVDESHKN